MQDSFKGNAASFELLGLSFAALPIFYQFSQKLRIEMKAAKINIDMQLDLYLCRYIILEVRFYAWNWQKYAMLKFW